MVACAQHWYWGDALVSSSVTWIVGQSTPVGSCQTVQTAEEWLMYWMIMQSVRGAVQAAEMDRQQSLAVQSQAEHSTELGQE